ncbi:MAG: hypothetical protein AAGA54_05310 [Myxococcota bacterium]
MHQALAALSLILPACGDDGGGAGGATGQATDASTGDVSGDVGDASGSAGSDGGTVGTQGTETGIDPDTGDSSTTDEPMPECEDDMDCLDPAEPFCDPQAGTCAACVTTEHCPTEAPVCDAGACRPCSEHADCEGSACKILGDQAWPGDDWGQCFGPEATVITLTDPAAVPEALDAIEEGDDTVVVLDFAPDALVDATASMDIVGNRSVAVIALGEHQPLPLQSIRTADGARLWLHQLDVRPEQSGYPIGVDGGYLHLQRVRVRPEQGGSLSASGNGVVHVENSFLVDISPGSSGWSVVQTQEASVSILYSTLISAPGSQASTDPAIRCLGDDVVDIRNSLVLSRASSPPFECDGVATTTSIAEVMPGTVRTLVPGLYEGQLDLVDPPEAWLTTAAWLEGDPRTDIYSTARPTEPGSADVAGAYLP